MSSPHSEISNLVFYVDEYIRESGDRALYLEILERLRLAIAPTIEEATAVIVHDDKNNDILYFASLLSEHRLAYIVEARWLGNCDDQNEVVPFGIHDLTEYAQEVIDATDAAATAYTTEETDSHSHSYSDTETETETLIDEASVASV